MLNAAGGHNLLMAGPPGAGKTLLARSMPSTLPRLTLDQALDITRIHLVAELLPLDTPLVQHGPSARCITPSATLGWWAVAAAQRAECRHSGAGRGEAEAEPLRPLICIEHTESVASFFQPFSDSRAGLAGSEEIEAAHLVEVDVTNTASGE